MKMKKGRKRISILMFLSVLLSLALVLGVMPGMSLKAYANDQKAYAAFDVTTDTNKNKSGNDLAALQVTFNGRPWYIIEDNSTNPIAGTVTLLAADTSFGLSEFTIGEGRGQDYNTSTVKAILDALTASGGSFADVADAIVTNTNAGGKLYLLSTDEANQLSGNVLKMKFPSSESEWWRSYSDWWLRSPSDNGSVAYVLGEYGAVSDDSSVINVENGIRPALKLNLSSVIFSPESKSFTPGSGRIVTYKVVNGTWSDNSTESKTEIVASGSKPANVPTGMKASEGYTGGAWDIDPANTAINESTTFTYTFTAKQAATITTPPTAKTLTYNGQAQELITAGTAEGGTMQYALGKDATTAPTSGWDTSVPTAIDAGTYYVWYKVIGDVNHFDSNAAYVTSTIIRKKISAKVTFKVVNGTWNDGKDEAKTVTLSGLEGESLKLKADQIPAVGKKPAKAYKAGSWDVTPDTSTAITKNVTYTYTYAKAASKAAKVTKAPTAKKLTYNGKDQILVSKGTASNGTMYYAVTRDTTAPKASAYEQTIPAGKAAGTYYVWYKAKGNKGYKDSGVNKVKVTIARKTSEIYGFNTSFKCVQSKGKAVISWTKQSNVAKVKAYVTYCGTSYPETPITTEKNSVAISKIKGKKLDQTKIFKVYLIGYDSTGKKVGRTVTAHFAGKDNKAYTNVKSFTLDKAAVTIKTKKSAGLKKSTIKLESNSKKQISDAHAEEMRFKSTNPKIAKVDKNGKITGVSEGECYVYAYARNGLSRKVKVTVTK